MTNSSFPVYESGLNPCPIYIRAEGWASVVLWKSNRESSRVLVLWKAPIARGPMVGFGLFIKQC